jgi:hypothetical protein
VKVFIERFECDCAVVETENNEVVKLPRALVPPGAKIGSVLSIALEARETRKKQDSTAALIEELWKD